jgi:hypothetical protein
MAEVAEHLPGKHEAWVQTQYYQKKILKEFCIVNMLIIQ